jgi:hypothetical protein
MVGWRRVINNGGIGAHDENIVGSGHHESEMAMAPSTVGEGIDVALA